MSRGRSLPRVKGVNLEMGNLPGGVIFSLEKQNSKPLPTAFVYPTLAFRNHEVVTLVANLDFSFSFCKSGAMNLA